MLPLLLVSGLVSCTGPGPRPGVQVEQGPDASTGGEAEPAGTGGRMDGSPSVIALLDAADFQSRSGSSDRAAAILEQALRLDPKNAILWSRLAQVRYDQGDWQQAAVLASKSNSLARNDKVLQLSNWRLIEQAGIRRGDVAAVEDARSNVRRLEAAD